MGRDHVSGAARVQDADGGGAQANLEPAAGEPGRHRVVGLPDTDPGLGIDPARQCGGDVETLVRQWPQQWRLPCRGHAHGLGASPDPAGVVARVRGGQRLVERRQRSHVRDRGQVPAAEPADLALDPALLVRPLDSGSAEE
ncbi:hypothetical protein HJ581_0045580 [Rhodococcus opacus]|nr:hypothetical protein HJ581_0045580 [Rhodococcus opacus]